MASRKSRLPDTFSQVCVPLQRFPFECAVMPVPWHEFVRDKLWELDEGMPMIRFAGLDGHEVAVSNTRVHHVVSHTTNGAPVCNLYFDNGSFVSVKGTMDEVLAIVENGNEAASDEDVRNWRKVAELRRKAALDVQAVIKESNLFGGDYKTVSHYIDTDQYGAKTIKVHLRPNDHPAYNKDHPANKPDAEQTTPATESDKPKDEKPEAENKG